MPEIPAMPLAILNFFSRQPGFEALMGDLREEFVERARGSGLHAARRWFWREAFRNAWALTVRELMQTPLRTAAMALASLFSVSAVTAFYTLIRWFLVHRGPADLVYDPNQFYVLVLLNCLPPLAVGWIAARWLPGREWALALAFTLLSVAVNAAGAFYLLLVAKVVLPRPQWELMLLANPLRHASFWVGALRVRYSTLRSGKPERA